MKKWLVACMMVISSLYSADISVAAAANVKGVLGEIAQNFTKETGIKVNIISSSSGKLAAQIKNGAPFDIFMSADMEFPLALEKEGLTTTKTKVYAYGSLVLWSMKNPLTKGLQTLNDTNIAKIAIANPKTAPYGTEAINIVTKLGLMETLKSKIITAESISQVNTYISSQAVDVGFTAKSVVCDPANEGKGKWIELDHRLYNPIDQGVVILKYGSQIHKNESSLFYSYLFSAKAKELFVKYGYILPK